MTPAGPWEESAQELYDQAPCGYLSTAPDGTIVRVNDTLLDWTGHTRAGLLGRAIGTLLTGGGRIYYETHVGPLLSMQGKAHQIALDLLRADGSRLPALINSTLLRDPAGEPLGVRTTVFDATDRRRYEQELLAARRAAEESEARLRVLQQTVADLSASPTAAEVAGAMIRAPGAAFGASGTTVWLAGPGGCLVAAASTEDGPAADLPAGAVLDREAYAVRVDDRDTLGLVHQLSRWGKAAMLLAPLTASGAVLGAIAFTVAQPREFAAAELDLIRLLGQQAGQALERARLYEQQRDVAETLQRSLLAGDPPGDDRFGVETHYRAATRGVRVGGDWYDAFMINPDRLALVVGDVVGRGLEAASTMGQVRSAVRALATAELGPARLLERLDRFAKRIPSARMATVAYAELALPSGELTYSCAGHLPPLVHEPAAEPRYLWGGRSAPLGSRAGRTARVEARSVLTAGSRLLLYTDGLIERRDRPLDEGFARLAEQFALGRSEPLAGLAGRLADALGGDERRDDVCLLCLSYGAEPRLEREIPADPARLTGLRRELRWWLRAQGVDERSRDAVVLACSEAVANAIEHGYRGEPTGRVTVVATLVVGAIRLVVRDAGNWWPGPPARARGRGLDLIHRLMDVVRLDNDGGGTTVTMSRHVGVARPPGAAARREETGWEATWATSG